MFYTLLGRLVWTFAKRRYRGRGPGRRSLLGGLAAVVAAGAGTVLARRARTRRQRQG